MKKRRNNFNKFYEINLVIEDRLLIAQKELITANFQKCLYLLNSAVLQEGFEQVPLSKAVGNLLNSFSTNNAGVTYLHLNKRTLALLSFRKAREILCKNINADDKEYQLYAANFAKQVEKISENIGLILLSINKEDAYSVY